MALVTLHALLPKLHEQVVHPGSFQKVHRLVELLRFATGLPCLVVTELPQLVRAAMLTVIFMALKE
jgi:hypothetical protein